MGRSSSHARCSAGAALALTVAVQVLAAQPVDPNVARVENGLLPIAAEKVDVAVNIADRMRAYGVPGVSIAVIDQGRIAWAKGYGIADQATGRPVTSQTLFQAASISKPISAVGALLLVQRGHASLDRNVNEQLRHWRVPESDLTSAAPITMRMLLNHTAGLAHDRAGDIGAFAAGDRLPTLLQTLRGEPPARSGAVRVVSPPGKAVEYSAAGYEVLQQLVADVSGEPFEEYMRSKVFEPIGMTRSSFEQPLPAQLLAAAASGHYAGKLAVRGRFQLGPELAVAGLWTTPTDIARYVIRVQESYAGSQDRPLQATLVREMLRPGPGNRGLGPALSGSGTSLRFGHDGFNEGFEASFTAYVHAGRGAVVMTNSGFAFMLIKEILGSISRVYAWPEYGTTTQQPPAANISQQLVTPVPARMLTASTGKYSTGGAVIFEVFSREGRLFLDWPGFGIAELFATPAGTFFCPQLTFSDLGNPWLQFVSGSDGRAAKVLVGDDGTMELRRIE
jgi:CubicO group peptidase (beta-lactamase class C family)